MNWGQRLLIVFAVFATGMIYLAWRCMHINTDLVTKEYYKDELKYQDVIDGTKRANALSSQVAINRQGGKIAIRLPNEMKHRKVSGNIWFYCAADAAKDKHVQIDLDQDASQQIDEKILKPGRYTVKFDWSSGSERYYSEQPLTIL